MDYTHGAVLQRFEAAATKFMTCVDSAPTLESDAFLLQIGHCLAELYCAALDIPDVQPESEHLDGSRPSAEERLKEWKERYDSLTEKLGTSNGYWVVFDSTKQEEPVQGSLADDITDIYLEVKQTLRLKEKGIARADLIFEIYLFFRQHWARHAIHALNAINDLRLHDRE